MEPINIKNELSNYRKAFGLVRDEVKKERDANAGIWSQEQIIPQNDVQAGWGARMEMPEELPDFRDDRVSGDPAMDAQNFEAYMSEHPFAQEKGEELLGMIEELSNMVKDPNNPMTLEEAQREFTKNFAGAFDEWEMGGEPNVSV